ncbi:LCP family protein [Clostridium sp. SHJSY1]|uniref:LCP family protein n=1 Tax=Clostridium sp. SHJSY1 TaxID=2942483 RepID=UPI002876C235|nr:LCP family protein [Clostridium sp. SHJSY1]MDS0525602.1 LCP family protein [Clostridium sp. SHJSY1]
MRKRSKVLIVIISILLILIGSGVYAYNKINRINKVELTETKEELNVSQETEQKSAEKHITNILLMGVDQIENASDSIMILSLDKDDKIAKLTSIMRDTYVYFGEGKANKINYAYHYGGVPLTISKLNELFNLDISKYAKVDFDGFMKIVDTFGGYDVDLTESQRIEMNKKVGYEMVKKSGHVTLTGEQTAIYARIRLVDSDFQRTGRQRNIMLEILQKAKNLPVTSYPSVASQLTSYIETNLSTTESLELGKILLSIGNGGVKEFRIPIDGTTKDFTAGVYHLEWEKEPNVEALHNFIYGSN